MKKRERTTWTAGRNASAPPATPGYGTEDQDHPAHQPDPSREKYEEGDPSAWAEDVREPPYPEGNPPATPGYDAEDQDHPAHQSPPRVPKEADLKQLVAKKATKCWKLANLMLENRDGVTSEMIEDQAYDLMDWTDSQIVAAAERLGKTADFLAEEKDEEEGKEATDTDIDGILAEDPKVAALIEENRKLKAEITAAKKSDDDDSAQEEEVEEEEEVDEASKKADDATETPKAAEDEDEEEGEEASKKAHRAFFASMDTDNDGFVDCEDWTSKKALFDAIDTDNDGIITADEFMDYMEPEAVMDIETDDGLDPEEVALLAEMEAQACGEQPMADELVEPVVEDEVVMDEPIMAETQDEAADEDKDKEAATDERVDEAGIFAMTDDPMGVGTTAEDDAILAEIFGGKAAAEEAEGKKAEDAEEEGEEASKKAEEEVEEEAEEEVEEASKKADKTAAQRPQPRKPAKGVQTVGAVTRTASGPSEVDELSGLWAKAPDVDPVFNPKD